MQKYSVVLFQNVTSVLKSEKILKENSLTFKIIPVPKSISSDCGLCIRFKCEDLDNFQQLLCDIENIKIVDI